MFSSSVSFGFWDWSGLVGLWVDDADVGSTKLRSSLTGSRGGFDLGDGMYECLGFRMIGVLLLKLVLYSTISYR